MRLLCYVFLISLSCLPWSSECLADDELTEDKLSNAQTAWFEKNIRPLLISKCYSCHSVEKGEAEGGLTLDSKPGWIKGGDSGTAIVPKDLEASLVIRAVRYDDPDLEMPPDKKLSDREIKLLEQWVQAGAPDPRQDVNAHRKITNPADPVAGKSHWSFKPLRDMTFKPGSVEPTAETKIDHFVLAKLGESSLGLNPPADSRTLLRRTYILLTGIPPTFEQIKNFESISSVDTNAYERLVDQLLASPEFGERWGRHWLDLARYADSNGLDENFLFREAWRYRNWVIDAVNDDQSFDEFTTEQLAGDLLPYNTIEQRDRQRIGSGFLVVGPKVLLGVNGELQKMDVADELIDTVGKTFLGQTLGCARCHDHKFDPIPTRDYYALAGIFTSTEVMQTRYMLGQQRKMERLFGIGPNENQKNDEYEKYWRQLPKLKQRAAQLKKSLEQLKKPDSKLEDILKSFDDVLADEVKSLIKAKTQNQKDSELPRNNEVQKENEPQIEKQTTKKSPAQNEEFRKRLVAIQEKHGLELAKKLAPLPIPPRAMIPADKSNPANETIRIAGQFNRKGDSVERGFLQVLSNEVIDIPSKQSGRKELAAWLTDTKKGAGHLTARVTANRIWHHLMGQGIVKTTDNFGRKGETPSHPKLLDYLANRLIETDWSIKTLVREIVLSQAFQQSSRHNHKAHGIDPENRLLWRAARTRLSPESYRDSVLVASNSLDRRPKESTVYYLGDQATAVGANKNRRRTDFANRSVYLPVIRNDLPEIFEAFDFADTHRTTGARPQTTVATTGLFILNDKLLGDSSQTLARHLLSLPGKSKEERVQVLFRKVVLMDPSEVEIKQFVEFVDSVESMALKELKNATADQKEAKPKVKNDINKKESENRQTIRGDRGSKIDENKNQVLEAKIKAWSTACHALFASSRFQILE